MRSVGLPIAVGIDGRSLTGDRESLLPSGAISVSFGPDLLLNGGFDTDTVWTKQAGWTIAAGAATFATVGSAGLLSQPAAFIVGRTFVVDINVTSISGGSLVIRGYLGAAVVVAFSPSITVPGIYRRITSAIGPMDTFSLLGGAVTNAVVESVSLRVVQ